MNVGFLPAPKATKIVPFATSSLLRGRTEGLKRGNGSETEGMVDAQEALCMLNETRAQTKTQADGTMAASMVVATVAFAVAQGISMERITEVSGLVLTDLLDPEARIPSRCAPAIWRLLREHFPGQAIPLRMADCIPPSFFGPMAHAGEHAASLRAALETLMQYRVLLSPELEISLHECDGEARVYVFHPADLEDYGWGSQSAMAIGVRFIREVMGLSGFLKGVEFAHAPIGALEEYQAFFGVPLEFNRPSNVVILHAELLDVPLRRADPRWFSSTRSHLDIAQEKLLTSTKQEGLEKIRQAIARCMSEGRFSAEAVARVSGMSLRTLQRRTLVHNMTLQALMDEARQLHACQLLRDDSLSVEEIAARLGYSTEGAFRRAFVRWLGVTPSRWRKENMAG